MYIQFVPLSDVPPWLGWAEKFCINFLAKLGIFPESLSSEQNFRRTVSAAGTAASVRLSSVDDVAAAAAAAAGDVLISSEPAAAQLFRACTGGSRGEKLLRGWNSRDEKLWRALKGGSSKGKTKHLQLNYLPEYTQNLPYPLFFPGQLQWPNWSEYVVLCRKGSSRSSFGGGRSSGGRGGRW